MKSKAIGALDDPSAEDLSIGNLALYDHTSSYISLALVSLQHTLPNVIQVKTCAAAHIAQRDSSENLCSLFMCQEQ
jgi:hypothetical protein